MVSPYNGWQKGDGQNRSDHGTVTKNGFSGIGGNDLRGDPQSRQQYDVYLRVTQEPEKVLIEYGRTPLVMQYLPLNEYVWKKKGSPKTPVHDQQQSCW